MERLGGVFEIAQGALLSFALMNAVEDLYFNDPNLGIHLALDRSLLLQQPFFRCAVHCLLFGLVPSL
jgi:hypothetical protein